jgi:hypothetical protein
MTLRTRWAALSAALLCLAVTASAQDKSPKSTPAPAQQHPRPADATAPNGGLILTEVERLTIESAQKDVIIQQQQAQTLRIQAQAIQSQSQTTDAAFGAALKALNDKAADIKKAHAWGDDVTFNQNFGTPGPTGQPLPAFTRGQPQPTPQPPTQPTAATPPPADGKPKQR